MRVQGAGLTPSPLRDDGPEKRAGAKPESPPTGSRARGVARSGQQRRAKREGRAEIMPGSYSGHLHAPPRFLWRGGRAGQSRARQRGRPAIEGLGFKLQSFGVA